MLLAGVMGILPACSQPSAQGGPDAGPLRAAEVAPEAKSAEAGPWEVDFQLSGGFAGMMKQLRISHDGRLVAENLKRRARVEKHLSPEELRNLDRMITQSRPAPAAMPQGTLGRRCADCINYRLTVTGTGERPARSESGTIEGRRPSDPDLIGFLISLLNQTVPP
jgi:hypothetical protein